MAAARDQAARIVRAGPETAEVEAVPETGTPLADQLRTHVAEETRRRPAEAPGAPEVEPSGAPPPRPPMPRRRNPASVNSS